MVKRPKRPRDPNQLGKLIVDLSVGEVEESPPAQESAAIEFARRGGLKGGPARAATLTPMQRSELAAKAARSRWQKKPPKVSK
jgi:hypothetical protein